MSKIFIVMCLICLPLTVIASTLPKEELGAKGKEAYANNDCLNTVKYLFAYLTIENDLEAEKRKSVESSIAYCESVLSPVKNISGWEVGAFGLVSAGGTFKPINPGSGGVLVTSGGDLKTIDTSTGGVLITADGVINKLPQKLDLGQNRYEYLPDFSSKDKLDLVIKKREIELKALDNIRELYKYQNNGPTNQ